MFKISYPRMGDYDVPIRYLLSHILRCEIIDPPKITRKTIELGSQNSPEFVCTPFKYTLGTFIEDLDRGANVLIQAGGGCRYGYYSELQIKILEDLGYKFNYINLVSEGHTDINLIYKKLKKIDKKLSPFKSIYYAFITCKMIKYMDNIDCYIRRNIGFENEKGSFVKLKNEMLTDFKNTKGYFNLFIKYLIYKRKFRKIKTNKPKNRLKVGIIGELYTIMEPFSNYFLEEELAKNGIEIERFTNVHYLLFEKKYKIDSMIKKVNKYITYKMGADAADNISRTKYLCDHKYDGIIHIKSSFCTPEIGAMPVINRICKEYSIPVIFLSFDANTSEVGIKTRLEAFYDMLEMRKKNELLSRN